MSRAITTLGLVSTACILACSELGAPVGAACTADVECALELCVYNRCLDPAQDDDSDGLTNAQERALGSDATHGDTDRDGRADGEEAPQGAAVDTDGDGVADVLESALLDEDGDCLPDQWDASSEPADSDALAAVFCSATGDCGDRVEVTASCAEVGPGQTVGGQRMGVTCRYDGDPLSARREVCDGRDNDCDGQIDESLAPLVCGSTGDCRVEVAACVDGTPLTCVPNAPSDERCDGRDNDCDGETDEGFALGTPCSPPGDCAPGTLECHDDGTARCSTGPTGSNYVEVVEACNDRDDDCDGETDEGFGLGESCGLCGGVRICTVDFAGTRCSSDDLVGSGEVCDGVDNDCDGIVDESEDLYVDPAACPQTGVCADAGVVAVACVAKESGLTLTCVPAAQSPWQPSGETACDGLDDDCDGLTDEDFTWSGAGLGQVCGLGACAGGQVVCTSGGEVGCSTSGLAQAESCDGIDNDCDGLTDEDAMLGGASLGQPCDGEGACGPGVVTCADDGSVRCSSEPGGDGSQAQPESCNAQDDDCDGVVDELLEVLQNGGGCDAPGVCGSQAVVVGCQGGVPVCNPDSVPGYEPAETTCDGLDNDCDGWTDEGVARKPGATLFVLDEGTPPIVQEARGAWVNGLGYVQVADGLWRFSEGEARWRRVGEAPERAGASLVGDPGSGRLLFFGGEGGDGHAQVASAPQWTFQTLEAAGAGSGRIGHAAAVRASSGWMFVIGGALQPNTPVVVALDVAAQQWFTPPQGPTARSGASAAHYAGQDSLLVFGGEAAGGLLGDTWLLSVADGGWTPITTGTAPAPRRDAAMAVAEDAVWLVGGRDAQSQGLGDTWRFDFATLSWFPVEPIAPLPARHSASLIFGEEGLRLLGGVSNGVGTDTFASLSTSPPTWAPVPLSALPQWRTEPRLASAGAGAVYIFSGRDEDGLGIGDLWRIDAGTGVLTLLSLEGPKAPGAGFASDPETGRAFVHGGEGANGGTVWIWDGAWSTVGATGMPALREHALSYDPILNEVLAYGGLGAGSASATTWRFDPQTGQVAVADPVGDVPGAALNHHLVWDPIAAQHLLVGGDQTRVHGLASPSLVWSHLSDWPQPLPADAPVVFEPESRTLAFHGQYGDVTTGQVLGPSPVPPHGAAVFAPLAGRAVVFPDGGNRVLALPYVCPQ